MEMIKKEKLKKIGNQYHLIIIICMLLLLVGIAIIFKPKKKMAIGGIEVIDTKVGETEEITPKLAKEIAVQQFKKLGEKTKEEDLEIVEIEREGDAYYYISSLENTLEIKIKGGSITKINSASIEE